MRKLYKPTKHRIRIHPSPPPPSSSATHDHPLSMLPFAIATLATSLEPEDQEVLAYLLSTSTTNRKKANKKSGGNGDHPPQFNCDCFRCYTSFWVRWDASPNQKMIHEIIDVYEDGLVRGSKRNGKSRKERRNKKGSSSAAFHAATSVHENMNYPPQCDEQKNIVDEGETGIGSSSVRKIVSFVGERIWGVWGV